MRTKLACCFIPLYLGFLAWGIVSHTLKVGNNAHPIMYFVVWDMFCGWSAWDQQFHIIAEGESGRYYRVAPAPWPEFKPYGKRPRFQYDSRMVALHKIAQFNLSKTEHEPIARILVIEECWSKKFNLPDHLWKLRYAEEKDPQRYFRVISGWTPEGELLFAQQPLASELAGQAIAANPRLTRDLLQHQPIYSIRTGGSQYEGGRALPQQEHSLNLYGN